MQKSHLLAAYLEKNELTQAQFGAIIGRNAASVCRWLNGERHPSLEVAVEIERATKGKVPLCFWLAQRSRRLKVA
jgi:transcriptional regulator with XRE-family HTH domain